MLSPQISSCMSLSLFLFFSFCQTLERVEEVILGASLIKQVSFEYSFVTTTVLEDKSVLFYLDFITYLDHAYVHSFWYFAHKLLNLTLCCPEKLYSGQSSLNLKFEILEPTGLFHS